MGNHPRAQKCVLPCIRRQKEEVEECLVLKLLILVVYEWFSCYKKQTNESGFSHKLGSKIYKLTFTYWTLHISWNFIISLCKNISNTILHIRFIINEFWCLSKHPNVARFQNINSCSNLIFICMLDESFFLRRLSCMPWQEQISVNVLCGVLA